MPNNRENTCRGQVGSPHESVELSFLRSQTALGEEYEVTSEVFECPTCGGRIAHPVRWKRRVQESVR